MNDITSSRLTESAARSRASLLTRLTGTCSILRGTYTGDAMGGAGESLNVFAADVPCHKEPAREGIEEIVAGQLRGRQAFMLHIPSGQSILRSDVVDISGVRFEVLAVMAPNTLEPIRPIVIAEV